MLKVLFISVLFVLSANRPIFADEVTQPSTCNNITTPFFDAKIIGNETIALPGTNGECESAEKMEQKDDPNGLILPSRDAPGAYTLYFATPGCDVWNNYCIDDTRLAVGHVHAIVTPSCTYYVVAEAFHDSDDCGTCYNVGDIYDDHVVFYLDGGSVSIYGDCETIGTTIELGARMWCDQYTTSGNTSCSGSIKGLTYDQENCRAYYSDVSAVYQKQYTACDAEDAFDCSLPYGDPVAGCPLVDLYVPSPTEWCGEYDAYFSYRCVVTGYVYSVDDLGNKTLLASASDTGWFYMQWMGD